MNNIQLLVKPLYKLSSVNYISILYFLGTHHRVENFLSKKLEILKLKDISEGKMNDTVREGIKDRKGLNSCFKVGIAPPPLQSGVDRTGQDRFG